jgi:hypothetical protein
MRGPNLAQVNVLAVASPAPSGSVDKSRSTRAGDRERNHQRRAHQEIRFDALMHARFEVSIAGKTLAAIKSCSFTICSIAGSSGPEFPMQVVQP